MRFFVVLLCYCFASLSANATSYVGGVAVNKNETNIEFRFSEETTKGSSDRFRMRQHIDYGFTDTIALRLVVSQLQIENKDLSHNNISLETRVQFIEKRDYGFNSGFRLIYRNVDIKGQPDIGQFRFLNEFFLGDKWRLRQNFIAEHELGENAQDGIGLSMRHQIFKRLDYIIPLPELGVGFELWNDFDRFDHSPQFNQDTHQIGLTVEMMPLFDLVIRPHYLMGISDNSPDHIFGIAISKKL